MNNSWLIAAHCDVERATSRSVHFENNYYKVRHLQPVLIFSILNRPRSVLVYSYLFGV